MADLVPSGPEAKAWSVAQPVGPQRAQLSAPAWPELRPSVYQNLQHLVGEACGPLARGEQPWRSQAACLHLPTNLFFPIGHGARARRQAARAKAVCETCPVQAECLDFALAANATYGVFGGLTEEERRELRQLLGHDYEPEADLEESA